MVHAKQSLLSRSFPPIGWCLLGIPQTLVGDVERKVPVRENFLCPIRSRRIEGKDQMCCAANVAGI
jgi:hypothetical protein